MNLVEFYRLHGNILEFTEHKHIEASLPDYFDYCANVTKFVTAFNENQRQSVGQFLFRVFFSSFGFLELGSRVLQTLTQLLKDEEGVSHQVVACMFEKSNFQKIPRELVGPTCAFLAMVATDHAMDSCLQVKSSFNLTTSRELMEGAVTQDFVALKINSDCVDFLLRELTRNTEQQVLEDCLQVLASARPSTYEPEAQRAAFRFLMESSKVGVIRRVLLCQAYIEGPDVEALLAIMRKFRNDRVIQQCVLMCLTDGCEYTPQQVREILAMLDTIFSEHGHYVSLAIETLRLYRIFLPEITEDVKRHLLKTLFKYQYSARAMCEALELLIALKDYRLISFENLLEIGEANIKFPAVQICLAQYFLQAFEAGEKGRLKKVKEMTALYNKLFSMYRGVTYGDEDVLELFGHVFRHLVSLDKEILLSTLESPEKILSKAIATRNPQMMNIQLGILANFVATASEPLRYYTLLEPLEDLIDSRFSFETCALIARIAGYILPSPECKDFHKKLEVKVLAEHGYLPDSIILILLTGALIFRSILMGEIYENLFSGTTLKFRLGLTQLPHEMFTEGSARLFVLQPLLGSSLNKPPLLSTTEPEITTKRILFWGYLLREVRDTPQFLTDCRVFLQSLSLEVLPNAIPRQTGEIIDTIILILHHHVELLDMVFAKLRLCFQTLKHSNFRSFVLLEALNSLGHVESKKFPSFVVELASVIRDALIKRAQTGPYQIATIASRELTNFGMPASIVASMLDVLDLEDDLFVDDAVIVACFEILSLSPAAFYLERQCAAIQRYGPRVTKSRTPKLVYSFLVWIQHLVHPNVQKTWPTPGLLSRFSVSKFLEGLLEIGVQIFERRMEDRTALLLVLEIMICLTATHRQVCFQMGQSVEFVVLLAESFRLHGHDSFFSHKLMNLLIFLSRTLFIHVSFYFNNRATLQCLQAYEDLNLDTLFQVMYQVAQKCLAEHMTSANVITDVIRFMGLLKVGESQAENLAKHTPIQCNSVEIPWNTFVKLGKVKRPVVLALCDLIRIVSYHFPDEIPKIQALNFDELFWHSIPMEKTDRGMNKLIRSWGVTSFKKHREGVDVTLFNLLGNHYEKSRTSTELVRILSNASGLEEYQPSEDLPEGVFSLLEELASVHGRRDPEILVLVAITMTNVFPDKSQQTFESCKRVLDVLEVSERKRAILIVYLGCICYKTIVIEPSLKNYLNLYWLPNVDLKVEDIPREIASSYLKAQIVRWLDVYQDSHDVHNPSNIKRSPEILEEEASFIGEYSSFLMDKLRSGVSGVSNSLSTLKSPGE